MPETTPDTAAYLFLGLGVTIAALIVFLVSMVTRWRSLQRDLETLNTLDEE
jgi:heme exporter protein D